MSGQQHVARPARASIQRQQQRQRRGDSIDHDPRIMSNLAIGRHDARFGVWLALNERAVYVSAGKPTSIDPIPRSVAIHIVALLVGQDLDLLAATELADD